MYQRAKVSTHTGLPFSGMDKNQHPFPVFSHTHDTRHKDTTHKKPRFLARCRVFFVVVDNYTSGHMKTAHGPFFDTKKRARVFCTLTRINGHTKKEGSVIAPLPSFVLCPQYREDTALVPHRSQLLQRHEALQVLKEPVCRSHRRCARTRN